MEVGVLAHYSVNEYERGVGKKPPATGGKDFENLLLKYFIFWACFSWNSTL